MSQFWKSRAVDSRPSTTPSERYGALLIEAAQLALAVYEPVPLLSRGRARRSPSTRSDALLVHAQLVQLLFLNVLQSISEIISFQILRSDGTFFFIHSRLVLSILFDLLALLDAFISRDSTEGSKRVSWPDVLAL